MMAILFTQPDGSDQHYDTYEEFEKAIILLKRLNGEKVPQDLLDEVRVDSSKFVKLSDDLDEANDKFDDINGEGERKLLPVGTKIRMLRPSNCGDLLTGDVGTITDIDERCPMGLVYSVRVRSGEDGYGWAKREDVEVVEDEHEFKVGDKVEVVGNRARHDVDEGEVREITRVDPEEPKYNLSKYSCGSWAHSEDIKLAEEDTQKIEVGDLVYVRESFTDSFGDEVKIGTYAKVMGFGSILFLTGVLVENKEQLDKLVLVAKKEDISI